MLDPIHNQGLRLANRAFRTSPVASLYVEADEPSLYSRREKLSLQYVIRLSANPSNPAHEVTFLPNYVKYFTDHSKVVLLLWIFYVFDLSCVCYVFVCVCLYVLCGYLLGKG